MALMTILSTLINCIQIYSVLLIVTILLSWFPQIDWYKQPFAAMRQVTNPFLNLFRGIVPPMGGMDFSPMLAIISLSILQRVLASVPISY
jgi:YggT family protein